MITTRKNLAASAIALTGLAMGVAAQEAPETQFQEEIDVRLVQIPILASDRQNRPITDLTLEDLVVKDRGRRVEIAFLEPFVPARASAPLPDVRLALDLPGGDESPTAAPKEAAAEPRHVIFYIDVENDQPLGKAQAAADLIRFVMQELDDSHRAAVVSFNGEIQLDLPFTRDRLAVTQAIRRAFEQPRRPQIDLSLRIRQLIDRVEDCAETEGTLAQSSSVNETCLSAVALDYADEVRPRSEDFLTGLEALVRFAAGLDGRKAVVAVSHGVAVNPADEVVETMKALFGNSQLIQSVRLELLGGEGARFQLDDVLDLAVRNEVTLNFVDRTRPPTGDFGARQGRLFEAGARPMLTAYRAAQGDLREIAATTGGVFIASTELYDGVKEAMDLERGGYYVGYYTDAFLPRGELAKVAVDSRRQGVKIRHRRGTYMKPRQGAEQIFRGRIALGSPRKLSPAREGLHVPFRIVADPHDLGYLRAGEAMAANFTLHVLVEQGQRRVASSYHFVQHAYPKELWDQDDVEPVTVGGWVELPLGNYRLVANFRNAKTGDGGRLARDLVVAAKEKPLPASDSR